MKNKKFTYGLAFAALIVWGLILHRVFNFGVNEDAETLPRTIQQNNKEPYNDYSILKDTAHLLLNYKDPFTIQKRTDTPKFTDKKSSKIASGIIIPFNWSFIKYSGYIHNPSSKKLIAVININGKTSTLTEGETIDQVKLIKNLRDSIKIAFNGKVTYIKMKSGVL